MLGKNSTKGKMKRLLLELRHHMNFSISGDASELRLLYIPSFRERFIKLLMSEDPQISSAIELMDDYGLDRDDIFENLDEFTLDQKSLKMANLDSKVKASFTREYNKGSHKSQALVDEQGVTKTRQRKVNDENDEGFADDAEGKDAVDQGYDSDMDDNDGTEEEDTEKILKLFKSSGKSKSSKTEGGNSKGRGKKK
jgi:replication factor C subunit 1